MKNLKTLMALLAALALVFAAGCSSEVDDPQTGGIAVFLPATTGDAANSALTLYFEAATDSATGDATLTLTGTSASETASYNVLGAESMTDALGNTVYDNLTGGQPSGYDSAKDIFSTDNFNGNDTVLAVGSVFTKQ